MLFDLLIKCILVLHFSSLQLQLKATASSIFKGQKDSYPQSVAQPFVDTRISEQEVNMRVLQMIRNEHIKYSVPVIKYDRNGFKPRPRQLILTQTAAYVIEEAKIKQRVLYTSLKGHTSMIIHILPGSKDVLILS
uniref:TH1 domain-containing protein n=1 Tax=Amphiprion percula TaxID=161767 RepID=A0A3P8U6C3_AMPPE